MKLSKSEITLYRSLAHKKSRDKEGLFTVEGEKMVNEALASDFEIVSSYRTEEIGEEQMAKISHLSSPSPAIALLKIPRHPLPQLPVPGLALALDSIKDPGNLGTILRLSDWFGITCIFASRDCVDLYNPKVVQASMGAIFRKKLYYCELKDVVKAYRAAHKNVYGTFLDGEDLYAKQQLSNEGLIIMGSENNGISPELDRLIDQKERLYIPPFYRNDNRCESLNVAIATAIICAEFRRRIL